MVVTVREVKRPLLENIARPVTAQPMITQMTMQIGHTQKSNTIPTMTPAIIAAAASA